MRQHCSSLPIVRGFFSAILCLFSLITAAHGAPVLETGTFVAAGSNETILHIFEPGRYSIQAQSPQGTRIELVDWMAGPMFSAGTVGKQDGRLDVLLDKGTYKLRLNSHSQGTGELKVVVHPFREVLPFKHPEELPVLEKLQMKNGPLGDLQQQSFWIYLSQRQMLRLEAIGRNLKDCRLWLDGEWLVDTVPAISEFEPVSGQPMMYVEFFHDLNPGLYLLTCYGGEPLAWAEESNEFPFYIRMGIPDIGTSGQRLLTISPFGRDTFTVSGETDFLELSRKDKKETYLGIGAFDESASRHRAGTRAEITKESRDPWCSLRPGQSQRKKIVAIQGTPGDAVTLNYFVRQSSYTFSRNTPRSYWVSNQASAEATDAIDVTAILARKWLRTTRISAEQSQVIPLSTRQPVSRKVNLLGDIHVFLYVADPGTYVIDEDQTTGAKGQYRIEPFLLSKPRDYRAPNYAPAGQEIELTKGFYVLSVTPESQGILSFVLHAKGTFPQDSSDSSAVTATDRMLRQRLLWPHLQLASRADYVLTLNPRQGVTSGLLVRPLPLNLSDPLPVTLLPGEDVPIQMRVKRPSTLIIENDQNSTFEVSGYAHPITSGATLMRGRYTLRLKNTGQQTALFSVKTVPTSTTPPLSQNEVAKKLQQQEEFPVLTEETPLFLEFDRTKRQHFTLRVDQPGLYRLETSGRLATRITVRNRFTTSLFAEEQNGIGRNALVQQYLKPGDYQITVQTSGRSKGRAGIHLRRVPLTEEAGLRAGIQKKIHLAPDEAVRYRFDIEQAGDYQLRSLGLNKTFRWRLEDHEGWPLVKPNQTGDIRRYFDSGTYHYFSLPEAVESRRVTALDKIEPARPALRGKGPHPIRLNETVEHEWREEDDRPPDVFVLDVPDPVSATISLSEDMEAMIYINGTGEIGMVRGGEERTFTQLLPGRYEIRVKSIEENDRLPYTLRIYTDQLITGLRYAVNGLPASFTVSTGDDSLVELFSFGTIDVKATLWQGSQLIARHDDMQTDWNFRISQKLKAGTYRLQIDPVGESDQGFLEAGMNKREEVAHPASEFPFTFSTPIGKEVMSIPFTSGSEDHLIHVHTSGNGLIKLVLFRDDRMVVEGEQHLFVPLEAMSRYTLFFWRLDESDGSITVAAEVLPTQVISLATGQAEVTPLDAATRDSHIAAYRLIDAGKISYSLKSTRPMLFSPAIEEPFTEVTDVPVVMPEQSGWLLCDVSDAEEMITLSAFALQKEIEPVVLGLTPLPFDLGQISDEPALLEIKSVGATLGAMIEEKDERRPAGDTPLPEVVNWPGMWIAPSQTYIAIPGKGRYRGQIWTTSDEPVKGKVLINRRSFPHYQQKALSETGRLEGEILPGEAHIVTLDDILQHCDVLLTRGLIAFVWQQGQTKAIAAAVEGNLQQQFSMSGGRLILLNTSAQPGLYRIERNDVAAQEASEPVQSFDPEHGFEQVFVSPGKLTLHIPESDTAAQSDVTGNTIFVAGDQIRSRFLRADGRIIEGQGSMQLDAAGSGLLEILYEPGYVRVWQSLPENKHRNFMGELPESEPEFFLDGLGTLNDRAQLWAFSLDQSQYIVAETGAPGITAIVNQDQVLATSVGSSSTGRQLLYFLPPGDYQLWTRPLKGVPQQGKLRLLTITPHDLETASAKPWLIQAGEIQVFRFQVSASATVGVGVQTESDRLQATLLDSQSQLLAQSPLILQTLDVGEYLFTVRTIDPDSRPVQYRPVVFGNHGSQQGIPTDVLKQYQELAR